MNGDNEHKVIPFPKTFSCDLPAGEDALHLNAYTEGLARFISTCPLPMTISLQGSWGSGKSSMMNLLEKALEQETLCITFNTWQYSQFDLGERLPILFYQSLMEKLGKTKAQKDQEEEKKIQEVCKRGLALAARLTARHFGVEGLMDEVHSTFQGATSAETRAPSLTETVEGLRKSFQELVAARLQQEKKGRAIFFVDDLDRLPPARAVELMEVLKTALECENCVFVLAIDYEVVLRGVKAKYGEDFGAEKGRSFFDKMIQLPFDLPVEQYRMEDFLDGLTDGIGDYPCRRALLGYVRAGDLELSHPEDRRYVHDMALLAAGRNPRSLKRFFNSFALLSQVARASSPHMEDRKYVLLFGVVALKTAYPKLYDHLMEICHSGLDLIEFHGWFHSDEAWARLQTHDPARAAALGLSGLSDLERARVRSFLTRFFQCELLPVKDIALPVPAAPEGANLTEEARWILSREGLPFTVAGWQTLEEVLEASAAGNFWGAHDRLNLCPMGEGNLRFHHLAAFLQLLTDGAAKEGWRELDMPRLVGCWQEMARRLADEAFPLAPMAPGKGLLDVQEGRSLPTRHLPESELWQLFDQAGGLSIRDLRLLLEQALQDGTHGGEALDRLAALGERFAQDPSGEETAEPFHTSEIREARIREYFVPPQVDQDALDRQLKELLGL